MRCALRSPQVIEMLRGHRTSLTSLAKIASVLGGASDGRRGDTLGKFRGGSGGLSHAIMFRGAWIRTERRRRVGTCEPFRGGSATDEPGPEADIQRCTLLHADRRSPCAFESARAKLGRTRHRPLRLEETVNALVHHFLAHERAARRTSAESKSTRTAQPRSHSTHRTRHIPHTTRDSVLARDGQRWFTLVGRQLESRGRHRSHDDDRAQRRGGGPG